MLFDCRTHNRRFVKVWSTSFLGSAIFGSQSLCQRPAEVWSLSSFLQTFVFLLPKPMPKVFRSIANINSSLWCCVWYPLHTLIEFEVLTHQNKVQKFPCSLPLPWFCVSRWLWLFLHLKSLHHGIGLEEAFPPLVQKFYLGFWNFRRLEIQTLG